MKETQMSDESGKGHTFQSASVTFIDAMKVHMGHATLEVEVGGKHYDIAVHGGAHRGFEWTVERWEPIESEGHLYAPFAGDPIAHGNARFFRDALQAAMAACRDAVPAPRLLFKDCKCGYHNLLSNGTCGGCGAPL